MKVPTLQPPASGGLASLFLSLLAGSFLRGSCPLTPTTTGHATVGLLTSHEFGALSTHSSGRTWWPCLPPGTK